MLITQDYGCELFKYMLEENKNEPFEFDDTDHKYVLEMIIANKLEININMKTTVEHIFIELGYFGCDHLLQELYKQIYDQVREKTIADIRHYKHLRQVEKTELKYIEHFTKDDLNHIIQVICDKTDLTDFETRIADYLTYLVENNALSEEFWKKNLKNVYLEDLNEIFRRKLSDEFLEYIINSGNEDYINSLCASAKLTDEFLDKHINKLDWHGLSYNENISELFFSKYADRFSWIHLSSNKGLSDKFFEKHLDLVIWWALCENANISESFFEKYINLVHWEALSTNENISEAFIYKYINNISWHDLCDNTKLSEEFWLKNTDEHIDVINFDALCRNQNLTETYFEKYIDKIKEDYLANNPNITDKFWIKHVGKIKDKKRFLEGANCKFNENDPRHPKNKYSIKYWMKVTNYFSFDKIWKKLTNVI